MKKKREEVWSPVKLRGFGVTTTNTEEKRPTKGTNVVRVCNYKPKGGGGNHLDYWGTQDGPGGTLMKNMRRGATKNPFPKTKV